MDEAANPIEAWRAEGYLSIDQEQAIRRRLGTAPPDTTDLRLVEVLAYLGAILGLIGGLILVGEIRLPEDPFGLTDDDGGSKWGAFAVALATAVALGAAARYLAAVARRPLWDRVAAAVALASYIALAVALAFFVFDIVDFGDASLLIMGLALLAASFLAYRWRPAAPTQLALAVSIGITIAGFLALVFSPDEFIFGTPSSGFFYTGALLFGVWGLAWMWASSRRIIVPHNTGWVLGAVATYIGAEFLIGEATGWLIVQLIVGTGLMIAGLWRGRTLIIALGLYGTVVGFTRLLGELFDDEAVPTAIVLVVVGAAALWGALLMQRRPPGLAPAAPAGIPPPLAEPEPDMPPSPPSPPAAPSPPPPPEEGAGNREARPPEVPGEPT